MLNNPPSPFAIRRVLVEGLFGQFTYDLHHDDVSETQSSPLLIIYGDNGSGKTTLLKLIFHMLTSEEGRGHKSFLARTQFKTLTVNLESGTSVIAERESSNLGSYTLSVKSNGSSTQIFFEAGENNSINLTPKDEVYPQYMTVMQKLSEVGLSLYFLQDNRRVWSDSVWEDEKEAIVIYRDPLDIGRTNRRRAVKHPEPILDQAIDRFVLNVKNQALQASSIGDLNVSTIYNEIAESIANSPVAFNELPLESPVHALVRTLEEQSERSDAFAKFGLSSQLSIRDLLSILHGARSDTLPILSSVLTPYVNGIKARLDAVEATYTSVNSLVEGINTFYSNKEVEFDLENGLKIKTSRGERLNPNSLSSGEQQLLLLFCNALNVQNRPTLFLIDEPELSLNVKWQRQLVQALLRSTSGRPIQFLLATHSLELLALHKERVVKLVNDN